MNNMTLIMPLAGRGSRFGDKYQLPKPLLDIAGAPMVVRAAGGLPYTERKIFIAQQEHLDRFDAAATIRKHIPDAEILGINGVTDGQATTCEMGIRHFGVGEDDSILISACDQCQLYDRLRWLDMQFNTEVDVAVWSFTGHPTTKAKPEAWGWLRTNGNKVIDVHCKYLPADLSPETTPVITGTMFFRKASYFLDALRINREIGFRTNGEFYVDNVLNRCVEAGLNVKIFPIWECICWGLPEDYEQNKSRGAT